MQECARIWKSVDDIVVKTALSVEAVMPYAELVEYATAQTQTSTVFDAVVSSGSFRRMREIQLKSTYTKTVLVWMLVPCFN